jgi:hypothetical protein
MAVQKERQHKSKLTIDCDNTSLSTPCKKYAESELLVSTFTCGKMQDFRSLGNVVGLKHRYHI